MHNLNHLSEGLDLKKNHMLMFSKISMIEYFSKLPYNTDKKLNKTKKMYPWKMWYFFPT